MSAPKMDRVTLLVVMALICGLAEARVFSVVAYLPEWRFEGANYDTIFQTVTHLILFSIEVSPTGELSALDRVPRNYLLKKALTASKRYERKLMICVGGNGRSAGFSPVVKSATARQRFISNLVKLCKEKQLDGVDYNWEYPGFTFGRGYDEAALKTDYAGFTRLLDETRAEFDKHGLVLTLAYYPDGRQEQLLLEAKADQKAHLLHSMSYDQPGRHSTLGFAKKTADQGKAILPPLSLTLGLPFYSRNMKTGDWKTYEDLVQKYRPSPKQDRVGVDEYMNGIVTIAKKVEYAWQIGLGGVMIWEVGQDCRISPVVNPGHNPHVKTCPDGEDSSLLVAGIQRTLIKLGAENAKAMPRDEL